jgi:hypothetical protein
VFKHYEYTFIIYSNRKVEKTTQQGALCSVLLTKYYSGAQIKITGMDRTCSMYGERRGAYSVLVGTPERRRITGKSRRRWEDIIKMDLGDVGEGHGLDRSGSGQGQMASSCECINEPSGSIERGKFLGKLRIC